MAKFHSIKVKEVKKETSDCVSISLDIPANLKTEFNYKQGQYITFKLMVNGEEIRRSYSLCSCPFTVEDLRVAVKKVKDGKGSTFLNLNLKSGDTVEVMPPMGSFYTELNSSNQKHYILFAGGSGITPMFSIVKSVLKQEANSKITLFYGNYNEEATIFKSELDALAAANPSKFTLNYIFENPIGSIHPDFKGLISQEKAEALLAKTDYNNAQNEFFICGPGPMMENVKVALEAKSVKKEKIHIEYFSAVIDAVAKAEASSGAITNADVTVILDGRETKFKLASNGKSILDASMEHDVDAPFACKGAVCCTCRAKIVSGSVKMDANFALTDSEVEQGYILTCQSHPTSDAVVIDFDAI